MISEDAAPPVGTRSHSARHITDHHDVELPVLLRLLEQVRPSGDAELVSFRWDRGASSPNAGTAVRLEATVTRRVPGADPAHAAIHQSVHVVDDDDRVRSRSSVVWSAPADLSPGVAAEWEAADFASVRWGARLRDRLSADPAFARAARSFDGTIAFTAPDRQVHFRIYRGAVVEVARKSLDGATFAIDGPDLAWVELLGAASNDFVRRASEGRFRVHGSGYQYLRMIKTVMIMLDHARAPERETVREATRA
ncbi:hypothetical protein D0T12_05200 [Actinomadura spongiicola]|uniref:SCP2 domain-containing protein n=1 Tax=Actinomadura spongiicola TaxID=2303421 RepID=A0A372GKY8_9ACTN|nr:hypothetical protein [Actinomadura spongiicola]RFS86031.1 hypothetical protein D0T12_05200 [Actinomadura spongiicola]